MDVLALSFQNVGLNIPTVVPNELRESILSNNECLKKLISELPQHANLLLRTACVFRQHREFRLAIGRCLNTIVGIVVKHGNNISKTDVFKALLPEMQHLDTTQILTKCGKLIQSALTHDWLITDGYPDVASQSISMCV